jgi:hypothetical protein
MKFLLTLIFFSFLSAQPLVVSPTSWDFGVVKDSEVQYHIFEIENTSQSMASLVPLPSSCGCSAHIPYPNLLLPKEIEAQLQKAGGIAISNMVFNRAKLYVSFDPKGRRGKFFWEVALQTGIPEAPSLIIPLQASILIDGILSEKIVNFKIFRKGESKAIRLYLACHNQPNFQLKQICFSTPGFDSKWEETIVSEFFPGDQRGYKIDIIAKDSIAYGKTEGVVTFFSDILGHEKIELRVFAFVLGDIVASANYLAFGVLSPGHLYKKKIWLHHHEYQHFKIESIHSTLPCVSARIEKQDSQYYHLDIDWNCPPSAQGGEMRGIVQIETDCPTHKIVEIQVQGIVMPAKE